MKIYNHLWSFLAVTRLVSAVPAARLSSDSQVVDGTHDLAVYGSGNDLLGRSLVSSLEARMNCRKIGNTIMRIGTSAAVAAFIHVGTDYASYVCEQQNAEQCVRYVGIVQHGLDGLFLVMGFAQGSIGVNNNDYQQSFGDGAVKRDHFLSPDWDLLDQVLRSEGWKFDSMEHISFPNVTVGKRDSDPSLVHRTIARNVAVDDQGNTSDIAFNFFDNGDLNLHIAGDSNEIPSGTDKNSNSHLKKRFNGPGFKIAATTRVRSKLTRDHQRKMAYFIAQDWARDTHKMSMSDYVGLVKTGHTANFYFRIIPETKGFGLNYESVNVCGQLAQFL